MRAYVKDPETGKWRLRTTNELGEDKLDTPYPKADFGLRVSLEKLGNDILLHLCRIIAESSADEEIYPSTDHPLGNLSQTSKAFRERCIPFLFRHVRVRGRESWDESTQTLQTLNGSGSWVLRVIRNFEYTVVFNGGDNVQAPSEETPSLLTTILQKMPNLEEVTLMLPVNQTGSFSQAFQEGQLNLPTVQKVILGAGCHILVACCPYVNHIAAYGYFHTHNDEPETSAAGLLRAALKAKYVTELEFRTKWTRFMVDMLTQSRNKIHTISGLSPDWNCSLEDIIAPLADLRHLRVLRLDHAFELKVGYYPPRCGNAYRHPGVRVGVIRNRLKAEDRVAEIFNRLFGTGRHLERFDIGDTVYRKGYKIDDDKEVVWIRHTKPCDEYEQSVLDEDDERGRKIAEEEGHQSGIREP